VIAVTGVKREAALLRKHEVLVLAGGGAPERLAAELDRLAAGAAGIISFGMAGALDPSLRLGEWVIADRLAGAVDATCDRRWVSALSKRIPEARTGSAWCDGRMITEPKEKQDLRARSGAILVDMESHVAAEAAARADLPFAILRCISDEADTALPPAVAVAMQPDGRLALGKVLRSILDRPGQLSGLIRSLGQFSRAYVALGRGARAAGTRFGFDER